MSGPDLRLKLTKSWEGEGPFLVLFVTAFGGGRTQKLYLTIDANQKTRGIRAETDKRQDLKPAGGVVAQLRKHVPSGGLGGIWREEASGDLWVPIYTRGGDHPPEAYIQLTVATPPELRLIQADGTVLVRKSSQGTFTKKRAFEGTLPLTSAHQGFRDVTAEVFRAEAPEETEAPAPEDGQPLLPEHQREARSRLARKLKTVRKYAQKTAASAVPAAKIAAAERVAALLKENLWRVKEGMHELVVDGEAIDLDPDASPGNNLENAYANVKKLRRAAAVAAAETKKTAEAQAGMERELERLRAAPLRPDETAAILKRFKILPLARTVVKDGIEPRALPYRRFEALGVPFLVGKGAADNDELTRAARGDDWWFHAVGMTGSHVIVPARQLKGGLTAEIIRAGCILALHHSRARDNLRGEVYVTQKRNLRKKKGLPIGLWLVERAETMFVTYQPEDAQRLLEAMTM